MARASIPINHFLNGEWDDNMSARTDVEGFNNSLRECENFIPTAQGQLRKRGGTFRTGTSDTGDAPILIPFNDNLMVELTTDNCRVLDADGDLAGETSASTLFGLSYSTLNWAQKDDLLFICDGVSAPHVFTCRDNGTSPTLTPLVFDKGPLDTQNTDLDLYYLASAVSGTGITLTAYNDVTGTPTQTDSLLANGQLIGFRCIPQALHNQWVTGTVYGANAYVWSQSYESSRINVYKTAAGGTAGTRAPGHDQGTESDGTVLWQLVHSEWGFARVTSTSGNPRVATADVVGFPELPQDTLTGVGSAYGTWRWAEGLWGKTDNVATGGGAVSALRTNYPRAVVFHQQRAVFAGGDIDGQQIHGSAVDDFTNFYPGLSDANAAYNFILDSDVPVKINTLASMENLMIGSTGGVYLARASNDGPITPIDVDIRLKSKVPISIRQQGAVSNESVFWIANGGSYTSKLYEFVVKGTEVESIDHSFLNENLRPIKVVRMNSPYPVIWCYYNAYQENNLITVYKLCGFSQNAAYGLKGWHRHEIGGTFPSGGGVRDLAIMPGVTADKLWLSLERDQPASGGSVEIMSFDDPPHPTENLLGQIITQNGVYLDGAQYQSGSITTITGLGYLEGETIDIVKDGAVLEQIVVSGNQAVMSEARSAFFYGVRYTAKAQTQRIAGGSENGSSDGKLKRIHSVICRLVETGEGLSIGTSSTNTVPVIQRATTDDMDTAVPQFTGDKKVSIKGSHDQGGSLYIEHDLPTPCAIAGLFTQIDVSDRT